MGINNISGAESYKRYSNVIARIFLSASVREKGWKEENKIAGCSLKPPWSFAIRKSTRFTVVKLIIPVRAAYAAGAATKLPQNSMVDSGGRIDLFSLSLIFSVRLRTN